MKPTSKLLEKYKIERDFHDQWAAQVIPEQVAFKKTFDSTTALENQFALNKMLPIQNKVILDLGCGIGDASLYLASKGAKVEAVDISPGMVELTRNLAKHHHLSSLIKTQVMTAEKLAFPDNYFDYVFGNGILHHAEPSLSLEEAYRVLKPGGKAIFIEPLAHNPAINLYRKLAKDVRTPTENPLKYNQLDNLTKAKFKASYHQEFHFFTLFIFVWFFLIEGTSPNAERYWKKIINEAERVGKGFLVLNFLDKIFLGLLPVLKKYCWNTVLVFEK